MALIIKDKIGNVIAGTPTFSDKYDVITAVVGAKEVKAGQIVAYDEVFKGNGNPLIKDVEADSKYIGVVTHQNIKVELESTEPQVFKPGDIVGICIKGFITALGKKGVTENKVKDGLLDPAGIEISNIKLTGYKTEKDDFDILEVEIK